MTKCEIFDDIVQIMRSDASFCKDKAGGNAQKYRDFIDDAMTDRDFLLAVNSYLATFQVSGHLFFYKKGSPNAVPFRLKRYQSALYVAEGCAGLSAGDEIVAADGNTIAELAERYPEFFLGEPEERQGNRWRELLVHFSTLTVKNVRGTVVIPLSSLHIPAKEQYSFRMLRSDTAYLRFPDFAEEIPIAELLSLHENELFSSRNLIIDVRGNCGGTDTAFAPLLKFCLSTHDKYCGETVLPDEVDEINYTARNVDERLWLLERYRNSATPDTVHYFDEMITRHKASRGKGFLTETGDSLIYPETGTSAPSRVFVLTDEDCASSGESFVQAVSPLAKVLTVGRPTMGILDYSNLAYAEYGNFMLAYPTSRRLAIDKAGAMGGKGVPVDVLVPLSPEFFEKDKDIQKVFELIDE